MAEDSNIKYSLVKFLGRKGAIQAVIFFLAFSIYANTLGHNFAQDDAIVIYDNIYVKDGIRGIGKIFTTDSFSGFFGGADKSSLVSGGRYRPMTIAIFAVVHEIVGETPFIYHLLNVVMYALLCLLLYYVINLYPTKWTPDKRKYFALIATIVFAIHPVHTEVVANVKGLDEVFSLLFSLLALAFSTHFVRQKRPVYVVLLTVSYLIALLSKENAAAFLIIIPIVLYSFCDSKNMKRIVFTSILLFLIFIGYWTLRVSIVGSDLGDPPFEMMNNPFIKVVNGEYLPFTTGEKWASIIYGLGKYIQLLFVPHPLTHDYYPRHFGVVSFGNIAVWASLIMNVALILIALLGFRKRSFISFCILFFYVSISLMSNVIFPIGTHLSERFLFTPSVAIALVAAYGFMIFRGNQMYRQISSAALIMLVITASFKTMARNNTWKDDLTLFTTDVKISKNSAKVRNAAGGALLAASLAENEKNKKELMIKEAVGHLNQAVKIHPNYKEAYLLLGNAFSYLKDYKSSIESYDTALKINPYYDQASSNLLIVLREGARQAGAERKDFATAIKYLQRALQQQPGDFESTALMGTAYGSAGDHLNAIRYYEEAIKINPNIATTYVNLGYAQLNMGLEEDAQISFNRAIQIDPDALKQIQKQELE